jgi:hypothetical protein
MEDSDKTNPPAALEKVSPEKKVKKTKSKNHSKSNLGERLTVVRLDLSKKMQQRFTQTRVENELHFQPGQLHDIEAGRGGQIQHYQKLLNYYHDWGYNIHWLVAENNEDLPMYRAVIQDNLIPLSEAIYQMEQLKDNLINLVETNIAEFQKRLIVKI